MAKKYHSISNIVATVYCERKALLDLNVGDARPATIKRKAKSGSRSHQRFELSGRAQAVTDRRCFIATTIYGIDAPETNYLRAWRDSSLLKSHIGLLFTHCYYFLSPRLLPFIHHKPLLILILRIILSKFLTAIGFKK